MRLKCIKLAGFKSFVDPTTINFPSNLGAVVGPNGCGKSNVIDAVRWVMGESSAKNLRGESMTDVIFNGSGARKPVGQASVELVFDNHDRKLSGEYANFTEVSIKRKVDREAQSEYSLNGTKCRRKDITDIFLGTGLGARSYSIIEQGMVSRLIESKPEELRVFIEEAAGISKYKERRKETESRIKRTRANLERLADIREELERQLQHLQRQSVAAEKYADLKREERQASANLNALRWKTLDGEIRSNQEKINKLELELEAKIAEQRGIDASVEKHLAENTDLNDALGEVQARFYSLGNDIARIEQSMEHHKEKVDQMRLDLTETEDAWTQTREELDIDLRKITQLDAELQSVSPRLEQASAGEIASAKNVEDAERALQAWQEQWDAFNQQAEEPRQTAEVEQSRIQQLETMVERGMERKKTLRSELEQLESARDAADSAAHAELVELESGIEARQSESRSLSETIDNKRTALGRCADELDQARSELQKAKGKLASLEALQQAALGQDNTHINAWLSSKGLENQLRLGEGLQIESGWEKAVEMVLGGSLQSVCVEGLDQVEQLLNDFPEGRLALIDVSKSGTDSAINKGSLAPLSGKVSSDWDLSDWLQGIYVATSLSEALAHRDQLSPRESIVTAAGQWVGRNWLQLDNGDNRGSIAERRTLIGETFIKIKSLTEKVNVLVENQSGLQGELKQAENRRDEVQQELESLGARLAELKSEQGAQLAKQEEAEKRMERIRDELRELDQQITQEQENTSRARSRLQQALDNMAKDVSDRERLEGARAELQKSLEDSRTKARSDKDLAHELALKQQSIESQLQSTRETMDRMASQVQRSKERMESLNSQIAESDAPLLTMQADLETLLQQRLEVEKELTAAKAAVDENELKIRELEQERNRVQGQVTDIRESLTQGRITSEGASVKRDGLLQKLREDSFEPEQVLAGLEEEISEEECERELEKLGNRISRLGPINLAAIDEYKQQSERKVYLDAQNDDLEKALNTLQNAIRKIDKETRARFKDTFDKINGGLQQLFPRIFGGGHAYLDMTGDDLLDTGVTIMARPPGKRNSTIHLLSGGEKAMTAIALVFSIFHLNPSPFCMLDEVDAPLDDANVGRYADLVREMSKNIQFIFITHNKITMEMANQLLGVTMHEPGVSRIVAVDIEEAAELAAS